MSDKMFHEGSLVEYLNPRPIVSQWARQVRSNLVTKISILQFILISYWFIVMLHMDYPRHNWTFILAGMSLIQTIAVASKPQLPGLNGSNGMATVHMVFVATVWIYAIHWSFNEARRVRKWQVECIEYYPINLNIAHDKLVLQSMITTPIIFSCQLCVTAALSLPLIFDKLQEYRSQYARIENREIE